MTLDRFYPIFDHVDWLRRMLPLGVKLVQLRVKDQPLDSVREQLQNLQELHSQRSPAVPPAQTEQSE